MEPSKPKKIKKNLKIEIEDNNAYISASKSQKKFEGIEEEPNSSTDSEEHPSEPKLIDYKQCIKQGRFLPLMVLLQKNLIKPEDIIDDEEGSTLLHYMAYFGSIKPLRTVHDVFKGNINVVDYRG